MPRSPLVVGAAPVAVVVTGYVALSISVVVDPAVGDDGVVVDVGVVVGVTAVVEVAVVPVVDVLVCDVDVEDVWQVGVGSLVVLDRSSVESVFSDVAWQSGGSSVSVDVGSSDVVTVCGRGSPMIIFGIMPASGANLAADVGASINELATVIPAAAVAWSLNDAPTPAE